MENESPTYELAKACLAKHPGTPEPFVEPGSESGMAISKEKTPCNSVVAVNNLTAEIGQVFVVISWFKCWNNQAQHPLTASVLQVWQLKDFSQAE